MLFTVGTGGSWDDARIEVLKLGTGERKVLIEDGSDARYVPTGHLVYLRGASLMAVPVDLHRLEVTGSPVALVEGVLPSTETDPSTGWDIWALSLKGGRKSQPFMRTPFIETNLAFSPDGRWVAYQSDESGRDEVYVQPFPGPGSKGLVSTQGGTEPVWSHDGHELLYRSGDKMMAVPTVNQPTFHASKPEVLFEKPYWMSPLQNYDVTADGRRFLMIKESEQVAAATHINVVQNWFEELKRLVPTR